MAKNDKVGAVIVAGGSSQRMNGKDKMFSLVRLRSILSMVIQAFHDSPLVDHIVVVLGQNNLAKGRKLISRNRWPKVKVVCEGGARRQDSVKNGLALMPACDWVLIHDGARPFISSDIIERGLAAARATGAAVAAVPVTDTVKESDSRYTVTRTIDRENLWSVQTPQVFRFDIICEAYNRIRCDVTDDASTVEALGGKVKIYAGSYDNIKVTTPLDLELAKILFGQRKA